MNSTKYCSRFAGLFLLACLCASPANCGDLRLVDAVSRQDKDAARSLLKQRVDVNATQPDGTTALAWAAHWDDKETADLLIRSGANVNAANYYGATPLWLACLNGNTAMVQRLLEAGANPNAALESGETPLMAATDTDNLEAVKLLLAKGANPNAQENDRGQTALVWALAGRHPAIAQMLIAHGADVNSHAKTNFTPLMFAAQQGDLDSAKAMLAAGARVNEGTPASGTALEVASASGYQDFALFLLEKGADPNITDGEGLTPLHHASLRPEMLALVKALLARGVNPNTAVERPVRKGAFDQELNNVSKPIGATAFWLAATAGNAAAMQLLADHGANPLLATTATVFENTKVSRALQSVAKTTPLMAAAGTARRSHGNFTQYSDEQELRALEAAKLAVALGNDVNAADDYGQSALHAAAYIGADKIVQFLVDKGAKIDAMDKFGQTPLSIAQNVLTVGLGDNFDLKPRKYRKTTSDLLLQLGAKSLTESGVQTVESASGTTN